MTRRRLMTTAAALKYLDEYGWPVTLMTLTTWCKPYPKGYGIGEKVAGRWKVNPKKLNLLLEGKEWRLKEEAIKAAEIEKAEKEREKNPPKRGRPSLQSK